MDKPSVGPNIAPPGEEGHRMKASRDPALWMFGSLLMGLFIGFFLVEPAMWGPARGWSDGDSGIGKLPKINTISTGYDRNDYHKLISDLDGAGLRLVTFAEFSDYLNPRWAYQRKFKTITESSGGKLVVWWVYGMGWNIRMCALDSFDEPFDHFLVVSKDPPAPKVEVAQSTSVREWPVWKIVQGGTYETVDDLRATITKSGVKICDYTKFALLDNVTHCGELIELKLVRVSVAELGFEDGATYSQICARAKELGLKLCPAEVGLKLRLQYLDQPMDTYFYIAMEPITDDFGYPLVFCLSRHIEGLWLGSSGVELNKLRPEHEFVFCLPSGK